MFVLNENGHYFEIDTQKMVVDKEQLHGCRFFDDSKALLETVCREQDCEFEEVAGSIFYITIRDGQPVMIDDRGFASSIDEPIETFVSTFIY